MRKRERERERACSQKDNHHTHGMHHTHMETNTHLQKDTERERERMNISERFRGCEGGPYLHNKYTQTNATIR